MMGKILLEHGMEHLHDAASRDYAPAKEAVSAINKGLNAQILISVCDLFYYAGNIIDERTDEDGQPVFDEAQIRRQREDRAKRMGYTQSM